MILKAQPTKKCLAGRMTAMNEQVPAEEQMPPAWVGSLSDPGYINHLDRMVDYWAKRSKRLDAEATDLRASLRREENARLIAVKDADRYRFLRAASASDKITVETFGHPDGVCHLAGDDLDAAIDEAMGKRS